MTPAPLRHWVYYHNTSSFMYNSVPIRYTNNQARTLGVVIIIQSICKMKNYANAVLLCEDKCTGERSPWNLITAVEKWEINWRNDKLVTFVNAKFLPSVTLCFPLVPALFMCPRVIFFPSFPHTQKRHKRSSLWTGMGGSSVAVETKRTRWDQGVAYPCGEGLAARHRPHQ